MADRRTRLVPHLRTAAGWVILTLLLAALAGWWGFVTASVIAAGALARVEPRSMMRLGTLALLVVPLSVLVKGLPRAGEISSSFALDNLFASQFAFAGLALVVYGGLVDIGRTRRRSSSGEP